MYTSQCEIAHPSWYAIITDETKDVSNKEQLNISIRWVDDEYAISEEPIGHVQLPNTFTNTLVVIKDVLRRCNLPLVMCRGQAYDGAANMQGLRNGVATQSQAEVPSAIPVHCLAHCLQLVLQEAGRECRSLREALELVKEIVKLVKLSLKRSTLFSQTLESYEGGVTMKPLYPTRWTVRTAAFRAALEDYVVLQQTVEDISDTTHDEYGQWANGVLSSLEKFDSVFGLKLGHLLFGAAD